MNSLYKIYTSLLLGSLLLSTTSCEENNTFDSEEAPFAPYVFCLGISSQNTTAYYVVTAEDLMKGNINAVGKGIEQNGYQDYQQAEQTVFSIGGLGVTKAIGLVRGNDGFLYEKGDFVFNNALSGFTQIDNNTMIGMELPADKETGTDITFYTLNINDISITNQTTTPLGPLKALDWPSITGMCYSEGNVYVTYLPMNAKNFATNYTDTTFVAVYNYPELTLKTVMKDLRTGPAGSWNAFNGIFSVESGDMYIMSNSAISNGFSQSTKNAAFLRIPKGSTRFDESYYFDFETISGGLKPAHIKYLGDGLIFAEVSTINESTTINPKNIKDYRWGDKNVKCCIINLNKKTVVDIKEIPVHNGIGGRRFNAVFDGGHVYYPVTHGASTYIYRIDPKTATAEKGAKVMTSFVAGFFKLNP